MINDRPLESNPYLKARGESQLRAKHAFQQRAGWRFGLIFGALIVLTGYGWDALQLYLVHAEFWWLRLVLAAVTILPLAILAGGIGGYVNWLLKLPLWVLFGIAGAFCAIHLPFEGAQFLVQRLDPNASLGEYLRLTELALDSFGILALLSAVLGVVVGLAQNVIVNWAWERSDEEYRLTLTSWALLFLAAPLAFIYAFLFDISANLPLRAPLALINAVVESGLNDAPGQDPSQMETRRSQIYSTGQRWRSLMSSEYVIRLAASESAETGDSVVDVWFRNGANLRCGTTRGGEFPRTCYDLNVEYSRILSEFVPRGSFRCPDCEMEIADPAVAWQQQNAAPLPADAVFTVRHGAGSVVNVRVRTSPGSAFECLLSGTSPITIERCQTID